MTCLKYFCNRNFLQSITSDELLFVVYLSNIKKKLANQPLEKGRERERERERGEEKRRREEESRRGEYVICLFRKDLIY